MEDIDRRPAPASPPTPDAVLAEQLARCHSAVKGCFAYCGESFVLVPEQLEVMNVASRLMRVSVALAAALDKTPREFIHRVIVERHAAVDQAPMVDITPSGNAALANDTAIAPLTAGVPTPHCRSRKQPRPENRMK
jgi:hypothetical protein